MIETEFQVSCYKNPNNVDLFPGAKDLGLERKSPFRSSSNANFKLHLKDNVASKYTRD